MVKFDSFIKINVIILINVLKVKKKCDIFILLKNFVIINCCLDVIKKKNFFYVFLYKGLVFCNFFRVEYKVLIEVIIYFLGFVMKICSCFCYNKKIVYL